MTMSASPGTAAAASQPDSGGRFHIQKIAIVGAGPSGLAAAKHLVAVGAFAQIDVFEQQAEVGGVWNYSAVPQPAQTLNIPQTDAHGPPDQPVAPSESSGKGEPPLFPSPMYDDLHTNIPHTLMRYSDLPFPLGEGEEEGEGEGGGRKNCAIFPSRQVVQEYLVAYSRDVRHLIKFSTQVVDIAPLPPSYPTEENNNASNTTNNNNSDERWAVQTKNLLTYQTATETYDAIVVASGHYATPYVPAVEGLSAFVAAHPGAVSHSKLYRSPEAYRDKKVLVVGNSASGLDIASQIRSVARKPVLVSAQTPAAPEALAHYGGGGGGGGGGIEEVPEIRRFLVEGRGVEFWSGNRRGVTDDGGGEKGVVVVENGDNNGDRSGNGEEGKGNGRTETDIDAIIYCTGYLYTFPFFESLSSPENNNNNNNNNNNPPLVTDGRRVHGLAHHLLHARHPTLAFPGLPQKVIPFPLAEAQMGVVARLWANWLPRPTPAELGRWEQIDEEAWAATARDPRDRKGFHVFGKGEDGRYINAMHDWAMRADGDVTKGEGKKGRGRGRELPHWGEHDFWQRTIYAEAKMRFEKSGKTAKTLEELGFRFEPEKVVAPEKDDEQGLGRVVPTGDDDLDVAG